LATLLETASAFRLYRLTNEAIEEEGAWPMPGEGLPALAPQMARAGVALLICGGATCCCLNYFVRQGVNVVPWIAGDVPTVLDALRQNRLETLLAPGVRPGRGLARRAGFGKHLLEIKSS
jgi:predicted Fe-Mo cluster-binding NifX family protein